MKRVMLLVLVLVAGVHPGGVAAGQRGAPPRVDPLTATIRGQVTTADTGAPIRSAEVRAITVSGLSRLATTDGDGRFELRNLPAGQFRLAAAKAGFVSQQFGQRRPFEPPAVIDLAEGQRVTADLVLTRGGAIAGRVYDEFGEPQAGVRVEALRSRMLEGRRRLQGAGTSDTTDDTGAYRVYGLPPGEYYVAAVPPREGPGNVIRRGLPIFFPGTVDSSAAQRLSVGPGGEASATFQLMSLQGVLVSGRVLDAAGAPVEATVSLISEAMVMGPGMPAGPLPLTISGHAQPDGRFTLPDVPPGPYVLSAMFHAAPGPEGMQAGSMALAVGGEDLTGLTLLIAPGGSMTGVFVRDSGVVRPLPTGLHARTRAVRAGGGSLMNMGGDNRFRFASLSGPFYLDVEGVPEGWAVKAVTVNGVDVTDAPIDLKNQQNVTARVVLTDRVTEVNGAISSRGTGQSVIVFSDDATKWTYRSRYVRTSRVDDQGRFRISGLPPGERYLAVAVNYLDDGESDDPELLEALRSRATSFALAEAENRTIELRLVAR